MRILHQPSAPNPRAAMRSRMLKAGFALLLLKAVAFADTFTFNTDPLAGTVVRNAPGRQLVGGEQFISFRPGSDVFDFSPVIFGGNTKVEFANGPENALPSLANVVVLQTLDNDNNPLTPFGAFNAADLIAGRVTSHGAGVFVFFNQNLALPELIYSDDLASNQADLRVLARMINLNGQLGINSLSTFSTANFTLTGSPSPVPEPSTIALLGVPAGLIIAIGAIRKRHQARQDFTAS